MKVLLHVRTDSSSETLTVDDEVTIGRTQPSGITPPDPGLSRVNTTIFIDGDELLAVDENSTNGTFLNGERLSGPPRRLRDGDELRLGSETRVTIEIAADRAGDRGRAAPVAASAGRPSGTTGHEAPAAWAPSPSPTRPQALPGGESMTVYLLATAAFGSALLIIAGALAAHYFVNTGSTTTRSGVAKPQAGSRIPVRVTDPMGGEDEDDLDDLIASWEVAEKEVQSDTLSDVTVDPADTADADLNVPASLFADRQKKAFEDRPGAKGISPPGLQVPPELSVGFRNQTLKLSEMLRAGRYAIPLDFADLAQKRLDRELIEMPMATESFYLDVGGSASGDPFKSFTFRGGGEEIRVGSPKFGTLSKLAAFFKFDVNDAAARRQMRIRLLRMFQPRAKPILKEIADAYFKRFGRPLRVTSLTRSMDYQIGLNATNANSFKVTGEGSLPPHTSGCAFDLARKHMPVEEQNFVMAKLAEMERAGRLDALIEFGANACFHIFIYDDGRAPGK